jgi:purine-binding chemotaxis protein CheW
MGTQLKTELILGMGSLGDRFVVLLDIDRVFSADELALAQGLAETEKAV